MASVPAPSGLASTSCQHLSCSPLPTPQLSLLTEALTWIGSWQGVPLPHPTVAKLWLSLLWLYDPAFWWLPRDWELVNEASSRWKPMDKFFPFPVPTPHHRLLEEAVVSASLKISVRPGNPFGNTPDRDIFVLPPSGPHPMLALITASPDFTSRKVWAGRPQAQSDAGSLGEGGFTTYRKYSGRKGRTDSNTPKNTMAWGYSHSQPYHSPEARWDKLPAFRQSQGHLGTSPCMWEQGSPCPPSLEPHARETEGRNGSGPWVPYSRGPRTWGTWLLRKLSTELGPSARCSLRIPSLSLSTSPARVGGNTNMENKAGFVWPRERVTTGKEPGWPGASYRPTR